MIARLLYRESIHGVVNYVFGKDKIRVLGFQNTYSESATTKKQFTRVLHHLGGRHNSRKRYTHISINLPHGEKLSDKDFYKLAKIYMENMGYGDQPYTVVRHFDTQHQHVHIVTTTVKEDGGLIDLSHDFRRNGAAQKYLEKQFGLSSSPETKQNRELPLYRLPKIQKDDSNGVKFYIQDILNSTLQKYKVRSFEELSLLVAPYHIIVKTAKDRQGRIGISYGIDIDNGYKSRFIDGYTVHPRLSGPKLKMVFDIQSKSKVLPMHRKRLEKQLLTTFKLFKNIEAKDLPAVLKAYQKIDAKLRYDKKGVAFDFTIQDKSGYVFQSSEINSHFRFGTHPVLSTERNGAKTELELGSDQMILEVRKLIRNAFYTAYLNGYKEGLLSDFVRGKNRSALMPTIQAYERFVFFNTYLPRNQNLLESLIKSEFEETKNAICTTENKKERALLEKKAVLMADILNKKIFDIKMDSAIIFDLLQSLGVKYVSGKIVFLHSNTHKVTLAIPRFVLPKTAQSHISTGFINQNESMLDVLANDLSIKHSGVNGNSFFLPLVFPRLYKAMSDEHLGKFEKLSLKAYQTNAERLHRPFEKSAADYIRLFNYKGFYFVKKDGKMFLHSIYSKLPGGVPLHPKTELYLSAFNSLDKLLTGQRAKLDTITTQGRGHLENLWISYLIEKQLYDKASFIITNDNNRPNLAPEVLKFHMENGLRQKIVAAANEKMNAKNIHRLKRSVYAFSSLLGKSNYHEEEVFNGFRDELTDYGKFRSTFI